MFLVNPYQFAFWSPADVTTSLWLDASDPSTVTTSNAKVSQWNDKSGNNRAAIQVNIPQRPGYTSNAQNGRDALAFDGVDDKLYIPATTLHSGLYSVFMAAGNPSASGIYRIAMSQDVSEGVSVRNGQYLRLNANMPETVGFNTSGSAFVANAGNVTGWNVYSVTRSTTMLRLYANGTPGTSVVVTGSASTYPNDIVIGARESARGVYLDHWNGSIGELIIFGSVVSDVIRLRTEGYLAHKWGLTSKLPSGHPYRTTPP